MTISGAWRFGASESGLEAMGRTATKGRMIRLFCALSLPDDVVEALRRRQAGLPGASWRPPEALHITLAFYGEMSPRQADDLDAELVRAGGRGPLTISLSGVGAFGDAHRERALWAGVEADARLEQAAMRCEAAGRRAGLDRPHRSYRPHVTLAYLRSTVRPERVAAWMQGHNMLRSPPFRVDRFGLYSSVIGSDGGDYRQEREYAL